jgi:hypothetical protein
MRVDAQARPRKSEDGSRSQILIEATSMVAWYM